MKMRIIAAALAAFFMLPVLGITAFAAEIEDTTAPAVIAGDADDPADALDGDAETETEDTPDTDVDLGDLSGLLSLFMLMGMMGGNDAPAAELPALPPGTASVIDYNTDPDGRLFYTIMTPDEHVFYLVIDKNSATNNVYFLNAVTISDLIPLAQNPLPQQGGSVTLPPETPGGTENPAVDPPPVDTPQNGGNTGMYIIVGLLVIVGGGAGWYFKIYKPKQERMASGDEYDPSLNEADNDFADDWGDDSDDTDDSPPWDEESGDADNE